MGYLEINQLNHGCQLFCMITNNSFMQLPPNITILRVNFGVHPVL